ncbi:MAG: single-stranded DNA-binding protein [Pseudomonadota bacterium]
MLNKVMIIGRLGQDPELRYAQNGTPIASFSVATDESYNDREGTRVERTEWHRVSVFQRAAENCANYLGKGSLVYVEGSLQTRKWQDQNGQDRYTTEIKAQRVQFLDRRGEAGQSNQGGQGGYGGQANQGGQGGYGGGSPRRQFNPEGGRGPQGRPQQNRNAAPAAAADDDMGPAFPSEASGMDDIPF